VNQETTKQEAQEAAGRAEFELRDRLLAVRKRKLATGERTPTIEAVRRLLMDEQRGERDG
jgi:hypothetical protein